MTLTPPTPTRRTLLRTAAWTTPVVMVSTAAPAFAASNLVDCGVTWNIDWAALNDQGQPLYGIPPIVALNETQKSWSVEAQPQFDGTAVSGSAIPDPIMLIIDTEMTAGTLTVATSRNGSDGNGHFNYADLGQTSGAGDADLQVGRALKFATTKSGAGASAMTITLSFTRAVKSLAFTITDIDGNNSNQLDHVWIESINTVSAASGSFTTAVASATRTFSGDGLPTAPWIGNSGANNNSIAGNVRVSTGDTPVTEIKIRFGNHHTSTTNNRKNSINIGKISFQTTENICTA